MTDNIFLSGSAALHACGRVQLARRKKNYDRNRMFETLWACIPVACAIPEIRETIRMFEYTIRVVVIKFFQISPARDSQAIKRNKVIYK